MLSVLVVETRNRRRERCLFTGWSGWHLNRPGQHRPSRMGVIGLGQFGPPEHPTSKNLVTRCLVGRDRA